MKKFTRFLSTFLAVIMLVSLSIVASAAGDTGLINNQLEESLEPMLMGELKDTFGEDIDVEYLDDYDLNIAGETKATKSKAIVVIPGVGGTVLRNSNGDACWIWLARVTQIACNTNGTSVNTITAGTGDYGVINLYKKLCDDLNTEYGSDYDVIFFPYDWRMSNTSAAANLATAVNNKYDELILVAHSMGGLVASKYCANSSVNRNKVDKLITLGTPYTGTPELIYVAETGDFNVFASMAAFGNGTIKDLVQNFHCTYQLAPTERYGTNYGTYIKKGTTNYSGTAARTFYSTRPWAMSNGSTKSMYSTATTFHSGLLISGTHVANGSLVDTYKIVGKGQDTKSVVIYDTNGVYKDFETTNAGDGTVPRYSASNTQSVTSVNKIYEVSSNHMDLIKNKDAADYIKAIINGTVAMSLANDMETAEVNERGWLIGEDNKRIYFTVGDQDEVTLFDGAGEQLTVEGGQVCNAMGESVGFVGVVGDNQLKYCLRNDNYSMNVANANNISPIKVEYQDNGYYEHSVTYETVPATEIELNVSEYTNFDVNYSVASAPGAAIRAYSVVEPTHIMTEAELAERNDY